MPPAPGTLLRLHAGGTGTETIDELLGSWERLPSLLALALVATSLFIVTLRRASMDGRRARWQLVAWLGAMAALLLALGSPVDAFGGHLVSGHMVQHMLLGDMAPALAMLALTGGVGTLGAAALARWRLLRGIGGLIARAPLLLIIGVWCVTWGIWHTPWAYELALRLELVHAFEHGTLLVVGGWLWLALVDPFGWRAGQHAGRIGVAVAAMFFGAILTNTLTYVDEPTYASLAGESERLMGWSSIADQQLAGLLMLGGQALTMGPLVAVLIRRHLASGAARRSDAIDDPVAAAAATTAHPLGW